MKGVAFMQTKIKTKSIVSAAGFTLAIAALATLFTDTASEWYRSLTLPSFQPPAAVFTIVWPMLYLLFAASFSWYVSSEPVSKNAVLLFLLNGVLNPLWTYVFFYRHHITAAVFLLIAMLYCSITLYKKVYEKNRNAAYMLIPYILWLTFALYLNYETAFLN